MNLQGFMLLTAAAIVISSGATVIEPNEVASTAVAKANSKFLSKLYPLLVGANGQEKNLVLSPFSLSSALVMTYTGANGNTRDEIQRALFLPNDREVKAGYKEIITHMNSSQNITLDTANRIFVSAKYPLLESYIMESKKYFFAEPQSVDFARSNESCQIINSWVEEKTHKKIMDLIPDGVLSEITEAVLVNAIYFKGNWTTRFDKSSTRKQQFDVSYSETVEVDMMHVTANFTVFNRMGDLGCNILEMPYEGDQLSMLFLLTEEHEGFEEMERKLSSIDMSYLNGEEIKEVYEVAIPRFKVETTHKLIPTLKELGMVDMFDETSADFSGMTTSDIYISEAVQKASIEVNEDGSEAAGGSGIVGTLESAGPDYPTFICNRPFLFAIKDNLTGMILFSGRVMNPNKN